MALSDYGSEAGRHHSRRHDSVRNADDYLNPHTTHESSKRHREHRRSVSRRRDDDPRYYESRPRSTHSATHSSDDQRTRHRRRSRNAWPPQPLVESEARSLAKEAGGSRRLRESEEKVPSRGSIDQDPIIEDVPEFMPERRFVVLPKSGSVPTPPSSEDERKRNRRPSRLMTDFDTMPPEMQRRTASPYGTTKPGAPKPTRITSTSFLSPDVLTPPVADLGRRKTMAGQDGYSNRSPRTSPTGRKAKDYFGNEYENAIDDGDDHSRPSSRGSQVRGGAERGAPAQDYSSRHSSISNLQRRQTDLGTSAPAPRGIERLSRPAPLVAAAAAGALGEAVRSARDSKAGTPRSATLNTPSYTRGDPLGSRTASPATSIHSHRSTSPPPPARPARASTEYSQEHNLGSPDSRRASVISSRANSRPGTPPLGTATMPRMPTTDDDWSNLLAANAARRGPTKPPSRLSASMRADSMPNVQRTMLNTSTRASASLPYPVHEGFASPDVFMPQESEHQYFPGMKPEPPRKASQVPSAAMASAAMPSMPAMPGERPPRQARPSFTTAKDVKPPKPEPPTQQAVEVRPTKAEADAMLKRGLPGCSRPQAVAGYDDWYTLLGAPSLDFCPKCVDLFERTVYRKCFRRSIPRDLNTKVRCAFGTPWVRLAYLLSIQERAANLKLIQGLAEIDEKCDPCPGHQVAVRTWHGLRDDQGLFVRDFSICQADIFKLQYLLPTFKGFFQRLPDTALWEKKRCALRPETHRFSQYLDALIGLHDKAHHNDEPPDRMPFVALVEKKLSYRECERDTLLVDGLWHFIPAIPHFTVCEDCFEEIVEPEIKKGSDLAKRFNRAVQPNYGEGATGTSCQLYSLRMRQIFKSAIKDNDMKYLARKAKERREAELRLQEQHSSLLRKAQRYSAQGWPTDTEQQREKRRLDRELEKITAEWREDWE